MQTKTPALGCQTPSTKYEINLKNVGFTFGSISGCVWDVCTLKTRHPNNQMEKIMKTGTSKSEGYRNTEVFLVTPPFNEDLSRCKFRQKNVSTSSSNIPKTKKKNIEIETLAALASTKSRTSVIFPPLSSWRLPTTSGAGPSTAAAPSRPLRWRSSFRVPSHLEIRSSFRAEITS